MTKADKFLAAKMVVAAIVIVVAVASFPAFLDWMYDKGCEVAQLDWFKEFVFWIFKID